MIAKYITDNELAKSRRSQRRSMREGLCCVLSVKVPEPKFSSQTKDKLVSSEVRAPRRHCGQDTDRLPKNTNDAKILCGKIVRPPAVRSPARRAK